MNDIKQDSLQQDSGAIDLTLVVPAFNEQENVIPFYEETVRVFSEEDIRYQIVFVDDGSSDNTLDQMKTVAALPDKPCRVSIVPFSRNFGKEAALYAGMEHAAGQVISFIDADLQQQPATLLLMYKELLGHPEYDCVAAYQENRRDKGLRSWLSGQFYKALEGSSHMEVIADASDFRVFKHEVAQALLNMPEYHRFSKGLFAWVGFKTLPYPYTPDERNAGETSWSLKKLFKYALGGLISFTTLPLKAAIWIGGITSGIALLYLIVVVFQRLLFGVDVPGYATIVVLILLFGGLQLLFLGILGIYLGRDYEQGKHRPIYISRNIIDS